jgi:delta 1-pyrroline-5-carboxylate dehydrogenase
VIACPLRAGASRFDAILPVAAALLGGNAALLLPDPDSAGLAREVCDRFAQAEFAPGATAVHGVADVDELAAVLRAGDIDGVACAGDPELSALASRALAARGGPILPVIDAVSPLELPRFVHEKAISENTAATGGNAALLSQDEPD